MAGWVAEVTGYRVPLLQWVSFAFPMILTVAVFSLGLSGTVHLPAASYWLPWVVLFSFVAVPFVIRRPDLSWAKRSSAIVGVWGCYFVWVVGFAIFFRVTFEL